jgi:hypothetical protein
LKENIMATVDTTIRNLFLFAPLLHKSRTDSLHYLLCVIGNGYGWLNGELVRGDTRPLPSWTEEGERARAEKNITEMLGRYDNHEYAEAVRAALETGLEEEIIASKAVLDNLDIIVSQKYVRSQEQDATDYALDIYPQSGYAALMNIPDDVTDDWRAACDEMRAIAVTHGWKF